MNEARPETANSLTTPSRRTVLRTAAWSAPVVAVATAAPAFAVSPTATYGVTMRRRGRTHTGTFVSTNHPAGAKITVTFTISGDDWENTQQQPASPAGWARTRNGRTLTFTTTTASSGVFQMLARDNDGIVSWTVSVNDVQVAASS